MTKKAPRGQSFIEAMVALTIIITSVSSGMALVQSSITAGRIGGSQIVAGNLAREAVEVARVIRDSNWLAGRSFDVGLTDPDVKTARPFFDRNTATWTMEFTPATIAADDPQAALYLMTDGTFVQAAAQPPGSAVAPYSRIVTIDRICRDDASGDERLESDEDEDCDPDETHVGLSVTAQVQWRGLSGNPRDTYLQERLYDWR